MAWDPQQYLKFERQRTQPCADLLSRLKGPFDRILDLGCGPGNSTAALMRQFPKARILGLDPDERMLSRARADYPELEFIKGAAPGDLGGLGDRYDLVFSNACIHWIEDQMGLIRETAKLLRPGGIFAAQLPLTGEAPFYKMLYQLVECSWKKLKAVQSFHSLDPTGYYNALICQFSAVEIWRTDYCHVVKREMVLEWYRGSGLRPYLERLTDAERERFLAELCAAVERAFPRLADGNVFLTMPRLFFVAVR